MAPLPVIPNVIRAAAEWRESATSQIAVNVMHFRKAGGTPESLAAALLAQAGADMFHPVVNTASADQWKLTPLDGSSATITATGMGTVFHGEGSGDFSPASAVVVAFQTSLRGRSYRGRVYLPFIVEADMSDGQLTAGIAANLVIQWNAFIAGMNTAGWSPVVASYKHATAQDIVGSSVLSALATQRRRQTRVRYP